MAKATKKTTTPEQPKEKTSADMLGVFDEYVKIVEWELQRVHKNYTERRAKFIQRLTNGESVKETMDWEGEHLIRAEVEVRMWDPMMALYFAPVTDERTYNLEALKARGEIRERFANVERREKLAMLREAHKGATERQRRTLRDMTSGSDYMRNVISQIETKAAADNLHGYETMTTVDKQFAHMEKALDEAERLWTEENRAHPCQMCQQETNGEERSKVCTLEGVDYYVHKSCLLAGMKAEAQAQA